MFYSLFYLVNLGPSLYKTAKVVYDSLEISLGKKDCILTGTQIKIS